MAYTALDSSYDKVLNGILKQIFFSELIFKKLNNFWNRLDIVAMSLFISDSSEGIISIKRQRVHSLKYYSVASIIRTMRTRHDSLVNGKDRFAPDKSDAQTIFPFATLPDEHLHYFLPSYICDTLFQQMLDEDQVSPDIILAIAPYLRLSLTKLTLSRRHCGRINEIFCELGTSSLTSIDFTNNLAVDDSLIRILTSSSLPSSLRHLSLSGCTGFMTVKTLYGFSELDSLDLSHNYKLIFEYSHCALCRFIFFMFSFGQLRSLDLHMTNFMCDSIGSEECVTPEILCRLATSCNLQRLDLHINPGENLSNSKTYLDLYTILIAFKNVRYLDISGWPFLKLLSYDKLAALSYDKEFLGLYLAGVVDEWGVLPPALSSGEISGFSNEEQTISTLQHYYNENEYMNNFLFYLAGNLLQNHFKLTTENRHILTEYLYRTIVYYFQKDRMGSNYLVNSLCCLASVTDHDDVPLDMVQKLVECFAELLHTLNMKNFTDHICAHTILNCCVNVERFLSLDLLKYKLKASHLIFLKLATDIIARRTELLKSAEVCHMFNTLSNYIFRFLKCVFNSWIQSKSLFGSRFIGVDILMEYISVKFDLNEFDDGLVNACSCLMSATYLCYSNCLIMSLGRNSQILCNMIEKDKCRIEHLIGTLENMAEFCLQLESANLIANILPVVKPILLASDEKCLENVTGSIATVVYFAVGKEKWGWNEEVSEVDCLLDIAQAAVLKLNYKAQRNVVYSTLEYFYLCLSSSDSRIHHCVIWLVTNLMFRNPNLYCRMLDQDFLDKIKSLIIIHPKCSHLRILAEELLNLHKIGSFAQD